MLRKQRTVRLLLIALVCAFTAFSSAFAAGAEYRALLIGEQRFLWFYDDGDWMLDERNQRNIGDVDNLIRSLENVTGPEEPWGPFAVTRKTNLSRGGIRDAIRDAFADTEEQDLSVFFIATHGDETSDGDLSAAFTGRAGNAADREKYRKAQWISFETLAKWLKTYVKGRVFVILESCGSGSAIYDPAVPENKSGRDAAAERFVRRAVEAFSKEDPGISAVDAGKSTGDLRIPKFYVLTASAHEEKSYGWETGKQLQLLHEMADGGHREKGKLPRGPGRGRIPVPGRAV